MVRTCAALVSLMVVLPKVSDVGVTVTPIGGATPVPVRPTGEPVIVAAVAEMVILVLYATGGAVGLNTTLMVHVVGAAIVPAPRVAPQVPPAAPAGRANGDGMATAIPASAAPGLLRVSVCGALVVPSATFPKLNDVGVTDGLRSGLLEPWNSTAPMSTLFVGTKGSGLGLPKKSVLGTVTPVGRPSPVVGM
jgi:hypothetical protein